MLKLNFDPFNGKNILSLEDHIYGRLSAGLSANDIVAEIKENYPTTYFSHINLHKIISEVVEETK